MKIPSKVKIGAKTYRIEITDKQLRIKNFT